MAPRLEAAVPRAWGPPDEAPVPAPPARTEEDLARKQARREAKLLAKASRPLDPWERYRALTDAVKEGIDLAEMADRKVRFALVVMAGINVGLFVLTTRPELLAVGNAQASLTKFDRPGAASLSYPSVMNRLALPLAAVLTLLATASGAGELRASLEAGAAWQTRNDFRIPGDGGTLVPLADYESGPFAAFRASLDWDLTPRQSLRLLAAPLRVEATFTPQSPVAFQDVVFPAGRPLDATYVFNSYRLTWYWRFPEGDKWSFRLGATLKVRDAQIALAGDAGHSAKDDLGAVPLLYVYARYQATSRFALELEADALAAPQGRAEDVSLKGVFRLSDRVDVDFGYRLLEGGADNDEVYTFAFFHYAVAGVRIRL